MKKGMLRTILSMVLVLMLALTPSLSMAAAPYGELTNAMALQALLMGREVNVKLAVGLDKLTGTGIDDEQTQQAMEAVGKLLDAAAINVSLVVMEDGLRIAADAELSEQEVINGAVEIHAEQIAVETNVLPGKRLVVNTDDVMAMFGAAEITQEQIIEMLNQAIEAVVMYGMEAIERYGQVAMQFVESIEVRQGAGAAATETCDAIALTDSFVITGTQVKTLLKDLITAACEDQTLISMLGSLDVSAEDFDQAMASALQAIEEDTIFDPAKLTIALGYGDEARMSVVSMMVRLTVDDDPGVMLMSVQSKTDENGTQHVTLNEFVNNGVEDILNYDLKASVATPADGKTESAIEGKMVMNDGYQTMDMSISAQGVTEVLADSESMNVDETIVMNMGDEGMMTINANVASSTNVQGDDFVNANTVDMDMNVNMAGQVVEMKLGFLCELSSSEYVPAAGSMTDVDLLTLDEAGMEALGAEAESGLMTVAFTALSLLPAELTMMLMGQ